MVPALHAKRRETLPVLYIDLSNEHPTVFISEQRCSLKWNALFSRHPFTLLLSPLVPSPFQSLPPYLLFSRLLTLAIVAIALLLSACSRPHPCREACVVFIGDSILSNWPLLQSPNEFSSMQIVNHGIPGDTTTNMLARFPRDVIQLRPRVVVILGGLNDLTKTPLSVIEQNLSVMTHNAQQHKIQVVLATLPPAHKPSGSAAAPATVGQDDILAFNSWLKSLAEQDHFAVADFYSTLADDHGLYQTGLTYDGVHPTAEGYQRMEPLLRRAIQSAISNSN